MGNKKSIIAELVILAGLAILAILLLFATFSVIGLGNSYVSILSAENHGKAQLANARYSKQAMVEQARAELESAEIRAEAIEIVGQATKDFPEYREQEFIGSFGQAIENGAVKMVFVPTEGNIPILRTID